MMETFGVRPWELVDFLPSEISAMERVISARRQQIFD